MPLVVCDSPCSTTRPTPWTQPSVATIAFFDGDEKNIFTPWVFRGLDNLAARTYLHTTKLKQSCIGVDHGITARSTVAMSAWSRRELLAFFIGDCSGKK